MSIVAAAMEWQVTFQVNSLTDFDRYRLTYPNTTDRKVPDEIAKQLKLLGYKNVTVNLSVTTPA